MVNIRIWGFWSFWKDDDDIDIDGDNLNPQRSVNDDITIGWNNSGKLSNVNWWIDIWWENNWNINNVNGNVSIKSNNSSTIENVNWKITIDWSNSGNISSNNWNIKVTETNTGNIETISGNIKILGQNKWKVSTVDGKIKIEGSSLEVANMWISMNISVGGSIKNSFNNFFGSNTIISSWRWSSSVSVSWKWSIVQINWKTRIDWKLVGEGEDQDDSSNTAHTLINWSVKVFLNGKIEINWLEKEVIKWSHLDELGYSFENDGKNMIVKFADQKIKINRESTIIEYIWN